MARLVQAGWVLWLYDRLGTGDSPAGGRLRRQGWLAPGNAAHIADWRAVLQRARQEGPLVVAVSWSSGILPVLRSSEVPDALVDVEAPADRWSLVPPRPRDRRGAGPWDGDPWDDAAWEGIEPRRLIAKLGVPYVRLQGANDHVHGAMTLHAERMVQAARSAGVPVRPFTVLAGHIHGHPQALLEALDWALSTCRSD